MRIGAAKRFGKGDRIVAWMDAGETSMATQSNTAFLEPWLRRVRDVDDDTLAGLMQQLVSLRRLRNVTAAVACAFGIGTFGLGLAAGVPFAYIALMNAVLAVAVGFPVFAVGSLSVRRLFLKEAEAQGLSKAASMLVLTRAERRARFIAPWQGNEQKLDALIQAVRDPDRAD